jgi:hypothetical protein
LNSPFASACWRDVTSMQHCISVLHSGGGGGGGDITRS